MATTTTVSKQEIIEMIRERVELKSLKVRHGSSEETLAFTATIYLDGQIAGRAENWGRGGMTMLTRFHDGRSGEFKGNLSGLEEFASSLPDMEVDFDWMDSMEITDDVMIDMLADQMDFERDLMRHIKKGRVVYRENGQPDQAYMYLKGGTNRDNTVSKVGRSWLENNADVDVVYNDLLL